MTIRPRLKSASIIVAFLALPVALAPGLLRGEIFWFRDTWAFYWPLRDLCARFLAEGRLPLWTADAGAGIPLLATPAIGALYPLNLLLALLPSGIGLTVLLALHVPLAGLCARALAIDCGADRRGALFSGLVYAASGPFVSHLCTTSQLTASAWIPLALLGGRRYVAGGRARWAVAAAGAIALQVLGGEAQIGLYTGGAIVLGALVEPPPAGRPWRSTRVALLRVLAVGLVSLALSGIQVIPSLEWLGQVGHRSEGRREEPATGRGFEWATATESSWRPGEVAIGLLVPDLLGRPTEAAWNRSFGLEVHYVFHIWMGVIPLILAIHAGRWRLGSRAPLVWALFSVWLALGRYGGLYYLLYSFLPGFGGFHFPDKSLSFFAIGVAVLSGRGLTRWLASPGQTEPTAPQATQPIDRREIVLWSGVAAWVGLAIGLRMFGARVFAPDLPSDLRAQALADWRAACGMAIALALAGGAALTLARPGRLPKRWTGWGVTVLFLSTLVDLCLVNGPTAPTEPVAAIAVTRVGRALEKADPRQYRLVTMFDGQLPVPRRLIQSDIQGWHRHYRERLRAYSPMLEGRATLQAYASRLLGYVHMVEGLGRFKWLGALGARDVISEYEVNDPDLRPIPVGPAGVNLHVYRNRHALTRARLVGSCEMAASLSEARERLLDPAFPHEERVVLDSRGAAAHAPLLRDLSPAAARAGRSVILADHGGELEIETEATGPTLLFLADLTYPGWTASIDGVPAPLLVANGAFRAVPLPEGRHRVVLRMRSRSVRWGSALSLLGLVTSAALCWRRPRASAQIIDMDRITRPT